MNMRTLGMLVGAIWLSACGRKDDAPAVPAAVSAPDIVELDSAQRVSAGIALGQAQLLPPDTIHLTGTITFDAGRVSHVGPRTQGRVRRVLVDIGSHVSIGDTLALLDSPELGAAQARWFQALLARDVAARNFERAGRLYREGIVSQRRHLEAEAEFRNREAEVTATLQALSALGAQPDSSASGVFVLRAPFAGEIVDKHATTGEVVGPESALFVVGELNRVWLILDLYEADLRRVLVGARARVVSDAYPDRPFDARVGQLGAIVDTVSRSIKVRLEIQNPEHLLKPGMFARAGISTAGQSQVVGVRRDAVQSINGQDVVFRPDGPGRFRAHQVTVGPERAGGWIEIRAGLAASDTVVLGGAFALKAHLLRSALGEGGP